MDQKTEDTKTVERRTVVRNAAWTLPVILATVAAPAASASSKNESFVCVNRRGSIMVEGKDLTVTYRDAPLLYRGWVTYASGRVVNIGTLYGNGPRLGSKTWKLQLSERPVRIVIQTFNVEWRPDCCPAV